MDPDYSYLNAAVVQMLAKITSTGGVIDGALQPVYFIVGVLLLVFACIKFMWQRDLSPLAAFVIRYIQLMVLIFVSGQWMPLTSGYVNQMGTFGANAAGFDILQLAPGTVIVRGLDMAWKLYSENISWWRLVLGSSNDTIANLLIIGACLGAILLSIFMAAWIMLFFVVFKLASVIALVFLAFLLFDGTRFMAAPGLARILAYGVQMLVLGLVSGLFFSVIDGLKLTEQPHVGEAIALIAVMFFFGLLFKYTTNLAREQVSGSPSLDLHDAGKAMGATTALAAGVGGAVLGAAGAMAAAGGATKAGSVMAAIGNTTSTMSSGSRGAPAAAVRMMASKASAWVGPPTERQQAAASKRGVDIAGMTRGQASRALENLGKMDPSWY